MLKKLYIKLIFIIAIFCSTNSFCEQMQEDNAQEATKLPSFFRDLSSSSITFNDSVFYSQYMEKKALENFDNRFVIIHLWATWCMDCQNELITLNKLQKEFRKKPLLVLAISEDFKNVSSINEYFTKHKIDFLDIYLDKKNAIYNYLGLNHLPASYLVDFNGNVIASSIPGFPVDWEDEMVKKYIEGKVNEHHLLPPEYKSPRDIFKATDINQNNQKEKMKEQKKTDIIIN